jgi:hypothetical protein
MNTLKSALAAAAFAATTLITGCASLEAQFDAGDILATMNTDSQAGGD